MGVGSSCTDCEAKVLPEEMKYKVQPPKVNAKQHYGRNYQDYQPGMNTPQVHKDSVAQYTAWQAAKDPPFTSGTWAGLTSEERQDCIEWWTDRAIVVGKRLALAYAPRRISLVF